MSGRPVAWINAAADPRRGRGADAALETVLGYVDARIVPEACRHVPVPREAIGDDGLVADEAIRATLRDVLTILVAEGQPKDIPSPR